VSFEKSIFLFKPRFIRISFHTYRITYPEEKIKSAR
jgi:hypothetical protein